MSFLQLQPHKGKTGENVTYAHLAWSVWDKRKQRPRQHRFYIGRLDETGEGVVVNKKFASSNPVVIPLAEVKEMAKRMGEFELWLRNVCAKESGMGGAPLDVTAKVEVVGDVHCLLSLSESVGLKQSLEKVFGHDMGGALLGLAMHQVATGNPLYRAAAWLEQRELPDELRSSRIAIPQVYGTIVQVGSDVDGRERFLREWIDTSKNKGVVFYDATSVSTHSPNLEMAEWGYNRDDEKLPQLNYSLITARATGLPLCYRVVPGSIPDVSTLENTLEFLDDYGLKIDTLSLDRGYYSGNNMRSILNRGINVVVGAPWSSKQAQNILKVNRKKLDSPKRGFLHEGEVLRHLSVPWNVDMGRGEDPRIANAHLILNTNRRAEMAGRYEKAVLTVATMAAKETFTTLAEAKSWLFENGGRYIRCLGVKYDPDREEFIIMRKPNKISTATARMGYTLILSAGLDEVAEKPELLMDYYRGRDAVEKLFDSLKNEDGQHRLRTASDDSAQGRFFLGFISLILRAEMNRRTGASGLRKSWTLPTLLDELGKVKAATTKSGKRILLEVSKKQRELVAKLNLPKIK